MYVRRVIGLPLVSSSVPKRFRGVPAFGLFTVNRMTFCTKTRPEQVSPSDQLHDKPQEPISLSSSTNDTQSQQTNDNSASDQHDTQTTQQKESSTPVQANNTQPAEQDSNNVLSSQTSNDNNNTQAPKNESSTSSQTNDTLKASEEEEMPTDKMEKMRIMVEKYGPTLIAVQIFLGTASLTICWVLVATVLDVPAILAMNGFYELAQSQAFAKGGTVAIAFATHKALFPARLALSFAITPAVSRMNRDNSPFVRALGEFVDGVPVLAKFRDEVWPQFMKIAFPKLPQSKGKDE
eukprot:TRINITY_DN195_c0_g1_i1.p2 TRINITY_DN195_c0_g1~~TRINITY_DN195_c0_g1_i1.p2  ORF type:complete len:293 (-),score=50.45 TRINITY_DN195_c0_g1_i1:794-1672(-)